MESGLLTSPSATDPSPGIEGLGTKDMMSPELSIPKHKDLEQGEENEALEEIENILWMKDLLNTRQNRCKEALESWGAKDSIFTIRIDRKRKQSSEFQNEVYQLLGFFSVFQGVLLTAVAQANLLHCNNTWTATLLSALASAVTVIGVILKLRKIKELESTIANEEITRRALVTWQQRLRAEGEDFDFKEVCTGKTDGETKALQWRWLNPSFLAIIVSLILFAVMFVVSIRQILCDPGHSLAQSP